MTKYCDCGNKIVVRRSKGFKGVKSPKDKAHDLCQKCWKQERDRLRLMPTHSPCVVSV